MKKIILSLLFLTITINNVWAATISAQVDRNPVHMNESFTLFFETDESPDDDPDFSPLEQDFEILNQSQSSNVSIINGQYAKKVKWVVSIMAKRSGTLSIPAIQFGNDSSNSIRLSVKQANQNKASTDADLFMEMEIQPKKAWVQSQIIVTLRFLSAINLSAFSDFPDLKIEGVDTIIEKLGDNKQYQTKRGNRPYLVIESRLALFPQQSGTLKILPFTVEARMSGRSSTIFDPFQRNGQIKRVSSGSKDINVLATANSHKSGHWLPAKEIQVSEEWPEDTSLYKAGEPITRTLTIMADGLTSSQLPEFKSSQVDGLKQYPDKPNLQDIKNDMGITGVRQEKIAYIPARAGSYTLPPIDIHWWNTKTGQQESVQIPAKTIQIKEGDIKAPSIRSDTPMDDASMITQKQAIDHESPSSFWLWLSLFLAIAWFITLILWWWTHKQQNKERLLDKSSTEPKPSHAKANKRLKQACETNNKETCRDALLEWGKAVFPQASPTSLGQLGALLNEPLQSRLNALEASLYGQNNDIWQAEDLYTLIHNWENAAKNKDQSTNNSLEPLYK